MAEKRVLMGSQASRHICCPACGCRESYQLGDGRKKCRRCRKKYSCRLLRSRLSAKVLKQIALYFWLAVPAALVARELRLNQKTVCRHYALLRQGINQVNGSLPGGKDKPEQLLVLVGTEGTKVVLVGVDSHRQKIYQSADCRWKYGEVIRCAEPQVEIFCRVYLAEVADQQGKPTWLMELDKLAKVASGVCRRATCRNGYSRGEVMNETAFRFNHRSDPGVSAILYGFFKNG